MKLRGMDYFQVLIDHHIKKHGGSAHQAHIFLLLDGLVSKEEVRSIVQADPAIRWICSLRLEFTKPIPYARIRPQAGTGHLPVSSIVLGDGESWESILDAEHTDLRSGSPVCLQLIQFPEDRTGMLFTFNHILFDYQGIEQFLNGFTGGLPRPVIGEYPRTTGIRSRISEFFQAIGYAFRKGGRSIFSLRPGAVPTCPVQTDYLTTSWTDEEFILYQSCLNRRGLELQESIYLLAVSAMVIYHQFGTDLSRDKKMLFQLPSSTRTRKKNSGLLFNALSFFYFNLHPDQMYDLDEVIRQLSHDLKEQIRGGLPRAFLTFSDIYKVIPFPIYSWMLGLPSGGQLGSFNISILGQTFSGMSRFMGKPLLDVANFPSNTIQPGLTLVFYSFRGEFRMTTSWVRDMFDREEQMYFHRELKKGLSGQHVIFKDLK